LGLRWIEAAWLECTVDRGGADKRARRQLAATWRAGARACWCLPAAVEEDEPGNTVPQGCSPEHERRRDGCKEWWWLELGTRAKEGTRELGREGEKGSVRAGVLVPFYRGRGSTGEGCWGGNRRH
jgi:hypothetical protein